MRILYGVQATGNGHITRARTMAPEFVKQGIEVDFLFSGRDRTALFDMDAFGDYLVRRGLTFAHRAGRLQYAKTVLRNNLWQFYKDYRNLDLSAYDLVLTDFEPVSAWAARRQHKFCIGIAHQYAFYYPVPKQGENAIANMLMRHFAPVNLAIGVHWHHFNSPILPPLIAPNKYRPSVKNGRLLVYLPFEETAEVRHWLRHFDPYQFIIYTECDQEQQDANLHLKPVNRDGFLKDLAQCDGVICNAGFGLCSEAMQYGKKLLIKPLQGQMEQLSNALAAARLHLADVIDVFENQTLTRWLKKNNPEPIIFPNVASSLIHWLKSDRKRNVNELAQSLWNQVVGAPFLS